MKHDPARLPVVLICGILLSLLLSTCQKDPYEIGIDLLPPSDTLNVLVTDTCTVYAYSERVDSIMTDESGIVTLGAIMDPVFGKTRMNLFTQFMLSDDAPDFGTNPVLDSVVAVLYYSSYYGDTTTPQRVKVYEVSEDFYYDSIYYSNQSLSTYPNLLADCWYTPRPTDSVAVYGTNEQAQLRVNLSNLTSYFGNKLLFAPASALSDNAYFIDFMKGLYFESEFVSNTGALCSFSVSDPSSRLVLYFHNEEGDSLSYDFLLDTESARFHHIDHNQYLDACPELKQQIFNHDTAQGKQYLFLQGLGGIKVKLKIPYIRNFVNGRKVAINDALLLLSNANLGEETSFTPPSALNMIKQDTNNLIGFLIDESEGESYFGGIYDSTNQTYFFRITRHLQRIIDGYYTKNYDLYMLVNNPISPTLYDGRIVLNGTQPSIPGTARLKLRIIYTRLN